jgi:hypothetical protein
MLCERRGRAQWIPIRATAALVVTPSSRACYWPIGTSRGSPTVSSASDAPQTPELRSEPTPWRRPGSYEYKQYESLDAEPTPSARQTSVSVLKCISEQSAAHAAAFNVPQLRSNFRIEASGRASAASGLILRTSSPVAVRPSLAAVISTRAALVTDNQTARCTVRVSLAAHTRAARGLPGPMPAPRTGPAMERQEAEVARPLRS